MDRLEFLEKQSTPLEARIKAICVENHNVRVLISTVRIDFRLAVGARQYNFRATSLPLGAYVKTVCGGGSRPVDLKWELRL
jgi:hypothetical protein